MDETRPDEFRFADKVAEVSLLGKPQGYLLVTVPEIKKARRGVTYVDFLFVRRDLDEPNGWRYEDRVDPGFDSAQDELNASKLCWYGEEFAVEWLVGHEAERVRREVFADQHA
jgi:hypothetical protein